MPYDRFDPADFESRLRNRLALSTRPRVILDISTMSKLAILLALGICNELDARRSGDLHRGGRPTALAWRSSDPPKTRMRSIARALQIFDGVHGVVRVTSLGSVAMQGQPTAALVFMSFNNALTQVLLNTVYPSRLLLINGKPPVHSWREEATAWIHDQVRCEWEADNPVAANSDGVPVPIRSVSTLDYRDSVALLVDLYWELSSNCPLLAARSNHRIFTSCWQPEYPRWQQDAGSDRLLAGARNPSEKTYTRIFMWSIRRSPEGFQPEYSSGISWTGNGVSSCANLGHSCPDTTDRAWCACCCCRRAPPVWRRKSEEFGHVPGALGGRVACLTKLEQGCVTGARTIRWGRRRRLIRQRNAV